MSADPRRDLARTISSLQGERMGLSGEGLLHFIGYDSAYWEQPHVMEWLRAAARVVIADEVRRESFTAFDRTGSPAA